MIKTIHKGEPKGLRSASRHSAGGRFGCFVMSKVVSSL